MKKLLCATLLCFSITCFADNNFNDPNAIHQVYLNTGDIVFWKDINKADRAGHVAVVSQSSDTAENAKIMHSTDHPKYNAFVETHMLPSSKLLENNKYYWVIRIKDQKIRQAFIRTLNAWLQEKIPFNAESEALMNKWDDSMSLYSTAFKFKLQNQLFAENPTNNLSIPNQGYMCSEIIIIALQKAFVQNNITKLPASLQIDPTLCPPSTFMFAIASDNKNFEIIGGIDVPISKDTSLLQSSRVNK